MLMMKMVRGRHLFLESHRNNPDVLVRIKEIYLNIFDQMMPSVESFGDVNNGRDDVKADPTNVPCERVLGVLKYPEKALSNLQFDLLVQHAMAKFNKVSDLLSCIDTVNPEEFHSEISDIEKKMKQNHRYQQENVLDAARRIRHEILTQNLIS